MEASEIGVGSIGSMPEAWRSNPRTQPVALRLAAPRVERDESQGTPRSRETRATSDHPEKLSSQEQARRGLGIAGSRFFERYLELEEREHRGKVDPTAREEILADYWEILVGWETLEGTVGSVAAREVSELVLEALDRRTVRQLSSRPEHRGNGRGPEERLLCLRELVRWAGDTGTLARLAGPAWGWTADRARHEPPIWSKIWRARLEEAEVAGPGPARGSLVGRRTGHAGSVLGEIERMEAEILHYQGLWRFGASVPSVRTVVGRGLARLRRSALGRLVQYFVDEQLADDFDEILSGGGALGRPSREACRVLEAWSRVRGADSFLDTRRWSEVVHGSGGRWSGPGRDAGAAILRGLDTIAAVVVSADLEGRFDWGDLIQSRALVAAPESYRHRLSTLEGRAADLEVRERASRLVQQLHSWRTGEAPRPAPPFQAVLELDSALEHHRLCLDEVVDDTTLAVLRPRAEEESLLGGLADRDRYRRDLRGVTSRLDLLRGIARAAKGPDAEAFLIEELAALEDGIGWRLVEDFRLEAREKSWLPDSKFEGLQGFGLEDSSLESLALAVGESIGIEFQGRVEVATYLGLLEWVGASLTEGQWGDLDPSEVKENAKVALAEELLWRCAAIEIERLELTTGLDSAGPGREELTRKVLRLMMFEAPSDGRRPLDLEGDPDLEEAAEALGLWLQSRKAYRLLGRTRPDPTIDAWVALGLPRPRGCWAFRVTQRLAQRSSLLGRSIRAEHSREGGEGGSIQRSRGMTPPKSGIECAGGSRNRPRERSIRGKEVRYLDR